MSAAAIATIVHSSRSKSRSKVVRVRIGLKDRLFQPCSTPELACFTSSDSLTTTGKLPATIQAGRSQRKYKNTTAGGLGASAGAGLDAPVATTYHWRP
eukprot:650834-Pleurochrysis_carterae.AAC.1